MLKRSPLRKTNSTLKKSPIKKGTSSLAKKPLKKSYSPLKKSNKSPEQIEADKLLSEKRTAFYEECIEKVGIRSAITGRRLHNPNRSNYHHTLQKAKYRDCEFSFNVILPLSLDEHSMVESNPKVFKENIDKRNWCLENFEQIVKESLEWETEFMKNKIITDDTTN